MKVFGWITRGPRTPRPASRDRRAAPRVEALEAIELMSRVPALRRPPAPAAVTSQAVPFSSHTVPLHQVHALATTQTTTLQTATVPDTLTNFNQPFAPPLNLFDPSLGQLVAVRINASATLTSTIQSENTSTTSGADIQGFATGSFAINGLGAPITANTSATTSVFHASTFDGTIDFQPPSGVTFPPLTSTTNAPQITITDPTQLAAFVAMPGRTTVTPTLTAQAQAGANAPNGNLRTQVRTSASGTVTISYDYIPQCPPLIKLCRFGIHHQQTQLQLTFGGPLMASDAMNPANYVIYAPNRAGSFNGPGSRVIPVTSAEYDPIAHTVTITPAVQLNVHQLFQLQYTFACNSNNPVVIEFGGKKSLGGFWYHGTHFTMVNGRATPG